MRTKHRAGSGAITITGRNRGSSLSRWRGALCALGLAMAGWGSAGADWERTPGEDGTPELLAATEEVIILPEPIPDPIEPVNRGLWAVNKGMMVVIVKPSSKAYRFVVRRPIRAGIRNFGRNLGYPRRLVNNLLQGEWEGVKDETARFMCNTMLGGAGFVDVGTKLGIPAWEADFGLTLRNWGWQPRVYLMLPVAGPSNERDALGSVVDGFLNPISYFAPYQYIPYVITYNNLTDTVDDYVRVAQADFDPYYVLRYAWIIRRENPPVDLSFNGDQHPASLETLQAVFFAHRDKGFPEDGKHRTVEGRTTGRKLGYNLWLQPEPAPIVYILPGVGSHRLSGGALGLAELAYRQGLSVVTVSSTYNYEFIERASSAVMPGYTPVDANDLHEVLTDIDRDLTSRYKGRITSRALMGASMGGFHALYLAGTAATNRSTLLKFDRYVAINAPVSLIHATSELDDYFASALNWPSAERTENIERTFLKVNALAAQFDKLTPESVIPFDETESKFLVGLAFRLTLRDLIFLSQSRLNQGLLRQELSYWRREELYREILQYSFADYIQKIVTPYYQSLGVDLADPATLGPAVDLRAHTGGLRGNEKVRLIENANDILLHEDDLEWMRGVFSEDQLTIFERGGHLGNLHHPAVQQAIINALADLPGSRAAE